MSNIDDKILEDINNDAENIQIPDSLSPDNMMAKITKKKAEGYFEENKKEAEKKQKIRGKKGGCRAIFLRLTVRNHGFLNFGNSTLKKFLFLLTYKPFEVKMVLQVLHYQAERRLIGYGDS